MLEHSGTRALGKVRWHQNGGRTPRSAPPSSTIRSSQRFFSLNNLLISSLRSRIRNSPSPAESKSAFAIIRLTVLNLRYFLADMADDLGIIRQQQTFRVNLLDFSTFRSLEYCRSPRLELGACALEFRVIRSKPTFASVQAPHLFLQL